ncbi:DUF3606 domain-containing protein [Pseudomonas sp.]|uniref:DUF3606 domain-containing protein n=1 Tax=Pseudomonas sp. TaxID=306 RepID=UPI003FD8CA0F
MEFSMQRQDPTFDTDSIRININDITELKHWAKKFGVARSDIKSAVRAVGDSLTAVKQHLSHVHHA